MRLALAVLIAGLLYGTAGAQGAAPRLQALPPADRASLLAWLEQDCDLAIGDPQRVRLRAVSAASRAALLEAYEQGPPAERERTYAEAFNRAFDARAAALAREGPRLLGPEDAKRLQSVDRTTYVSTRLAQARLNYRTNAVLGLGELRVTEAVPLLQRISGEPDNPLRVAAQQSLNAMKAGAQR